ncbi:uncharacterized protein LOC127250175 [Andrographis paniculata]|uniref:uncharacterized protein LOC127250175 n=1 Tax=Andrographis paniculata TaxID=175694 RepID=UPI0021E8D3FB|nr:uncharacterized protein LOC127250175 [Andrographis paniculata]
MRKNGIIVDWYGRIMENDKESNDKWWVGLPTPPWDDTAISLDLPPNLTYADVFSNSYLGVHGEKDVKNCPKESPNFESPSCSNDHLKGDSLTCSKTLDTPPRPKILENHGAPKISKFSLIDISESDIEMKLAITKKRLQKNYQDIENAKRQRKIQMIELHNLPKDSLLQMDNPSKPFRRGPFTKRFK